MLTKQMMQTFEHRYNEKAFSQIQDVITSHLYDLDDEYHDRNLSPFQLQEELIALFSGGRETIPNVVSWVVYQLAINQNWQNAVQHELKNFPAGELFP